VARVVTSCCSQGIEDAFGDRTAAHELRRYRRKGPSKPTRRLLAAIRERGVEGAALLDIGGGVGAIQHELLDAGAARATAVEVSAAYLRKAAEESERRGRRGQATYRHGDFVVLAPEVEPADVVTLDRVICCYPDMEALVGLSAERARRLYGLVHPRDAWWMRVGIRLLNAGFWLVRKRYRSYVHPVRAVDAVAAGRGLSLRQRTAVGPVWQVALYERPVPQPV
jgi:predicted TPR repeat methyltransferase